MPLLFFSSCSLSVAGGYAYRTNVGEHWYWVGAGMRHQGVPLHHHFAGENEHGKGEFFNQSKLQDGVECVSCKVVMGRGVRQTGSAAALVQVCM